LESRRGKTSLEDGRASSQDGFVSIKGVNVLVFADNKSDIRELLVVVCQSKNKNKAAWLRRGEGKEQKGGTTYKSV
jgi:hypothetical protein